MLFILMVVFFFNQKTAYEMRISDWSSDVCSSDLGKTRMTEDEIGKQVVDVAVSIHREVGPGLLEMVYEVLLAHELRRRGLRVERQVPISIAYQGLKFDEGFRADLVVEEIGREWCRDRVCEKVKNAGVAVEL